MNLHSEAEKILGTKKYRDLGIPLETATEILRHELANGLTEKEAVKSTKRKLHNIIAPYLGDPDYAQASVEMDKAFTQGSPQQQIDFCKQMQLCHASTRERFGRVSEFYRAIFSVIGFPGSILDLACGLNPFSLPWMELPDKPEYFAYDLHQPRIDLINQFFKLNKMSQTAEKRDILVNRVQQQAEVAFFFKEAHRFEKRAKGCNQLFLPALKVRWLVVTLPAVSLQKNNDLRPAHRSLMNSVIAQQPDWEHHEIEINDEMIFFILLDQHRR